MTNTNTSSAAAQALQLLITAAQAGDNGALLKLCSDFKPLLSSEARREMFYNSLGKDAEGIAVLAFIELVLKYSGTDYVNWPGYALQSTFRFVRRHAEAGPDLGKRDRRQY